ncbi:TPA: Rha family transcriptional regulator [Citrobacter werkmanii]
MITLALQSGTPEVSIHDGKVITTSMAIAEYFHKRHDDVIKKIRVVIAECEPEYHTRNFAEMVREIVVGDGAIRKSPYFELTRDAFILIAMGFTGKKALQWKIRYIEAFNEMEAELLHRSAPPAPTYPPFSGDHANRTEIIYYQNFKPIFCRVLRPEETVLTPESMKEWMEMQGVVFFTREELKKMSALQLLAAMGK